MEWVTAIRTAIEFMESHLDQNISAQDVAERVYLSPFFFQRGFSLMTGYGVGEYLRNRRLYQAALDLRQTDDKVIDIALRYGYETPETHPQIRTNRRSSTTASVSTASASMTSAAKGSVISLPGNIQAEKCRRVWSRMNFPAATGLCSTASARSRRHSRV